MKNKWVRIFDDKQTQYITDIEGLRFLDYEEEGVDNRVNATEIQSVDGVLLSPSTFGPFNLKLRFFYRGADVTDYKLVKQKLRGMLFKRTPYFINHSDMPGIKYAVYCEENAITDIAHKYGEFEYNKSNFKLTIFMSYVCYCIFFTIYCIFYTWHVRMINKIRSTLEQHTPQFLLYQFIICYICTTIKETQF